MKSIERKCSIGESSISVLPHPSKYLQCSNNLGLDIRLETMSSCSTSTSMNICPTTIPSSDRK